LLPEINELFPPLYPQEDVTICHDVNQLEVLTMRFRMTASDCEVLHWVAECRLVTTPQLAAFLSRNAKSLTQRISQLVAEGLLAEVPRGPGQHRGRPERVISLTERGVQSLREREGIDVTVPAREARVDHHRYDGSYILR
jgi:hypothetical protein